MINRVSNGRISTYQHGSSMHRVCMTVLLALVVALGTVSLNTDAVAEPVAVQMKSINLPGVTEKGYRGRTAVTPYIVIQNEDVIERFCGRWPRVIDAILIAFENAPVDLKDKAADLASRQDALGKHIEEAVGVSVFKKLYLVAGSKRRAAGTKVKSSKFGTRDCQPIQYLPWEREMPEPVRQTTESIISSQPVAEPEPPTEAEVREPIRELPAKPFPAAPAREKGPSWIMIAIALVAMSGITIIIGSYIGYQVAKIRRDRRRKDRRMKKKDRRSGLERRLAEGPLPEMGDRRSGEDRRSGKDRRDELDRRAKRDRRDEEPLETSEK